MITRERIRDFYDAAFIQLYLDNNGFTLVYVDECHISMRSTSVYNWSPRGGQAIVSVDPDPWIMSFVIAVSKAKINWTMASMFQFEQKTFWWFINDVWINLNSETIESTKFIFIFDNASFNQNKETADFIMKKKIKWITILPYSPNWMLQRRL